MTPQELMRLALKAGFDVRPGKDGPWDIWATEDSFNRLSELLASDSRQEAALGQAYLNGLEEGRLTKLLMESYDKGVSDAMAEAENAIPEIVAREREACAQIADEWCTQEQRQFGKGGPGAAIRARGMK